MGSGCRVSFPFSDCVVFLQMFFMDDLHEGKYTLQMKVAAGDPKT